MFFSYLLRQIADIFSIFAIIFSIGNINQTQKKGNFFMLRIAVCDDEKIFTDNLGYRLTALFENLSVNIEISAFQNADLLIRAYRSNAFDVVFLDIDMPAISGFDAAKAIRDISNKTMIIFVTSKRDLVFDSFEFQPFYFICKSSTKSFSDDLKNAVEKIAAFTRQSRNIEINDCYAGKLLVPAGDILYIKSEKHYLLYYLNNSDDLPIRERGKLSDREAELLEYDFLKPHQRYLVNMNSIWRFDSLLNIITLVNKDKIPISKSLKAKALEAFMIFKRR